MSDLTDNEMALLAGDVVDCECIFCRAAAEIRRRRDIAKRLEDLADRCDVGDEFSRAVAAEIRKLMERAE